MNYEDYAYVIIFEDGTYLKINDNRLDKVFKLSQATLFENDYGSTYWYWQALLTLKEDSKFYPEYKVKGTYGVKLEVD